MATKADNGIKFYQLQSGHVMNSKIRLLILEHSPVAYWVWSCLLDRAYEINGYYFDARDQDHLLIFSADVCKQPTELVWAVIKTCVKRGLFNNEVFEKYGILTSDRMQRMYLRATMEIRKKGTECEYISEYNLLSKEVLDGQKNLVIVNSGREVTGNIPGKGPHNIIQDNIRKDKIVSPSAPPPDVDKDINKEPEPYWPDLVKCYSDFVKEKFPGETINWKKGARDPKLFKQLIEKFKHRAEEKKQEWTFEYSVKVLKFFLEKVYEEEWMRNHFNLKNLNEQFSAVFKRVAAATKQKKDEVEKQKQIVESKSNGTYTALDKEIVYLFERYCEGADVSELIKSDHYNRLSGQGYIPHGTLDKCKGESVEDKQREAVIHYFKNAKQNKKEYATN